jgi:transcriptional regulator with XRE-family HTH domain
MLLQIGNAGGEVNESQPRAAAPWTDVANLVEQFGSESNVATRVRALREEYGWSQSALAERMTDAGYAMDRTAIWKIENPDKPNGRRAITIGEMIAFAKVFECSIIELLLTPERLLDVEAWKLVTIAAERLNDVRYAWSQYENALVAAQKYTHASEGAEDRIRREIEIQRAELAEKLQPMWDELQATQREQGEAPFTARDFREWIAGQPVPLILAMEDTIAYRLVDMGAWAKDRLLDHPIPFDIREGSSGPPRASP